MKGVNITYWVSTGLFSLFMLFSGVGNAMVDEGSVAFLHGQLGYPEYIIPFLGVTKIVGSIVLLIPGFPRIKEWAYAGLFFDLLGATYSVVAVTGFQMSMMLMPLVIAVEAVSYICHHKRLEKTLAVKTA